MSRNTQIAIFLAAVLSMAIGGGVHESVFNNFLADTYNLDAGARGGLELPREFPGFMVAVMAGALCALAVTHLAVVGAFVMAVGMAGLALWGGHYWAMMVMMVVGSAGMHLLQPVGSSIAVALSDAGSRGRRMGQVGAVGTLGMMLGAGSIKFGFEAFGPQYRIAFFAAGVLALAGGAVYLMMHIPELHRPRPRLVIHRRFSLYYALEFLFGTRKQIFLTFGPWVLIRVYNEPASGIAGLFMVASLIGIAFKPLAGWAIDRFGERTSMVVDGIALAGVCLGYGYAMRITPDPVLARQIACACFVADSLLFALGTSRAVYLSRITRSGEELTSTLSLGISINHIASMTIPMVAGAIWLGMGYEAVFAAAALFALGISVVSTLVPSQAHWRSRAAAEAA